jgi:hypothetical protein
MCDNKTLIQVLRDELLRERKKIEHAKQEIWRIRYELTELGVEIDIDEKATKQ